MPKRLIAAVVAAALPLVAQATSHDTAGHAGHDAAAAPGTHGEAAATQAFREAAERMHAAMAAPFTGDADVDFARGMIGHHEGAIDMARIVLEHGSDPELRKMAEEIIEAQEREVAFLKDWLVRQGY